MSEKNESSRGRLQAKSIVESGIKTGLGTIGDSAAITISYLIQNRFGLRLEDAPDHPDDLCHALRELFGIGSIVLMRSIREKLQTVPVASEEERSYTSAFLASLEECMKSVERGNK